MSGKPELRMVLTVDAALADVAEETWGYKLAPNLQVYLQITDQETSQ